MGEDLMVSVTIEEFEQEKSIDKKLNLMFKVLSAQQEGCVTTVEGFDQRIDSLETSRKMNKAKIAGIGIGSGGGAAALIALIKSWFAGGGQ